jgi:hypothetical protein
MQVDGVTSLEYAVERRHALGQLPLEVCGVEVPDRHAAEGQPLMRPLLSQSQNPNDLSPRLSGFRVWLPGELPRRADHPGYFGLVTARA